MVDKVDGQSAAAQQIAEQRRLEEQQDAQRERLIADAAIERVAEVSQSEQVEALAEIGGPGEAGAGTPSEGLAGSEVSDMASDQQDRGESWEEFSSREDDSTQRAARELQVQGEAASGKDDSQAEKINVGDLMKDLALQSGRIKS